MASTRIPGFLGDQDYIARARGPFWFDDKGCHREETPDPTGVGHYTPIRVADARADKSKKPAKKTVFHPGVMRNHQPSGRWADVQAAPNTSNSAAALICKYSDPKDVISAASMELRASGSRSIISSGSSTPAAALILWRTPIWI
jgi:hypothetical protein